MLLRLIGGLVKYIVFRGDHAGHESAHRGGNGSAATVPRTDENNKGRRPGISTELEPYWNIAAPLEEILGYRFRNPLLLLEAASHSSFTNEKRKLHLPDNDRLEFLGDAVLGLVIGEEIHLNNRRFDSGKMTKLRAMVVSSQSLAEAAQRCNIGDFLLLGVGETRSGGGRLPSPAPLVEDAEDRDVALLAAGGREDGQGERQRDKGRGMPHRPCAFRIASRIAPRSFATDTGRLP